MRIAVWHNLPSGGGKRALYDHVRGLIEAGHEVEAWAPPSIDRAYLPLETLIEQHIVPLERPAYRLTDKLQLTLYMNAFAAAMEAHSRACAEQIARGGFDILLANSCMYFHSAPIGRFADMPSILYLQVPCRRLSEAMPNPFWAALPSDRAGAPLQRMKSAFVDARDIRNGRIQLREEVRNARAYGRILCNSFFSRENILRAYGVDAEVCYLGIDETQFRPGPEERGDYVVALGALSPHKNPRLCIEAVARMKAPRPRLVWIGNVSDPEYGAEMEALARAGEVELDIRIGISDEQLFDTLRHATAMIYAPRLEPFGLAPLEANACGTPVVAIAEGGIRETIVDGVNGLLAEAEPAALGSALQTLFDQPALARRLGNGGRQLVETQWSHRASTERLIAKLEAEIARGRQATARTA